MGAAFLFDTTASLAAAAVHGAIHAYVAYAPAGQEARFDGLIAPGTRLILADGHGVHAPGVEAFGRVLLHAATALFAQGYGAVALISADSPTVPTAWYARAAARILAPGPRALLGLAEDGGYWLIALQSPTPALFTRIAWSTDAAGADTTARAAEAGIPLEPAGTWFDVDDRDSLARLLDPAADAYAAPATMALVDTLGLRERLAA